MSNENDLQKKEVGSRIRRIRIEFGLTMQEFGEKLNPPASDSIVSRWERGISLPNNDRLRQIAELGNVSMHYLLEGQTDEEYAGEIIKGIKESKQNIIEFANSYDEFDDFNDLHYVSQFVDLIKKKNKEIIKYEELWHAERYARLKLEEEKNK